jgi:hypothetical protein
VTLKQIQTIEAKTQNRQHLEDSGIFVGFSKKNLNFLIDVLN